MHPSLWCHVSCSSASVSSVSCSELWSKLDFWIPPTEFWLWPFRPRPRQKGEWFSPPVWAGLGDAGGSSGFHINWTLNFSCLHVPPPTWWVEPPVQSIKKKKQCGHSRCHSNNKNHQVRVGLVLENILECSAVVVSYISQNPPFATFTWLLVF